ncbi:MAG: preprotein translocase subunit SecG [Bacteroidetes bacterium]|nr:MAG: preprotein translocase subunit SecG [Bacteroidota bacterium]TAG86225.1 MAG: preprotein translocase subunit SecG [Bacteroidota bacterium]
MYIFIIVLIILVSFLLTLIVLAQNPKGGGLNDQFTGGATSKIGARQAGDLATRLTWILGMSLFVLVLSSNFVVDKKGGFDFSSPNIEKAKQKRLPSSDKSKSEKAPESKTPANTDKKEDKK